MERSWSYQKAQDVRDVIDLLMTKYPHDIALHCEHDVLVLAGEIEQLTDEDKRFLEFRGARYEAKVGVWQMYVSN